MTSFEGGPQASVESPEARERREILGHATAYINAGGRGTRLESVLPKDTDRGITKALIDFKGEPIVLYHIERLIRRGVGKVVVLAGDHRHIEERLGERLRQYPNVEIRFEEEQRGTGGDLIRAIRSEQNPNDYALVCNVDTLLDVDEGAVLMQHKETGAEATIVLTTRNDVPNQGAFVVDEQHRVVVNREGGTTVDEIVPPEKFMWQGSSAGMVVFDTKSLSTSEWQTSSGELSVYRDLLSEIGRRGKLYAYDNGKNFFMDVGTPRTYDKMNRHPVLKDALENKSL